MESPQLHAGVVPASFQQRKAHILASLSIPRDQYTDSSPKGTVDEGIRQLIDKINEMSGYVTTSSCAGRISVFLEGRKKEKKDEKCSFSNPPKELAFVTAEEGTEINSIKDVKNELFNYGHDGTDRNQQQWFPSSSTINIGNSSVGGKGNGGRWLFVSHDPLPLTDLKSQSSEHHYIKEHEDYPRNDFRKFQEDGKSLIEILGMEHLETAATARTDGRNSKDQYDMDTRRSEEFVKKQQYVPNIRSDLPKLFCQPDFMSTQRLIRLKFEPMILHILTASLAHANRILVAAIQAGFRESGAVNLVESRSPAKQINLLHGQVECDDRVQVVRGNNNTKTRISRETERGCTTPMVAIRSTGLALESFVGIEHNGHQFCIVPEWQIRGLLLQVNQRFEENVSRIKRFTDLMTSNEHERKNKSRQKKATEDDQYGSTNEEWEDAHTRRARKREEGLAKAKAKIDDTTHHKPPPTQDSVSFISDLELLG
ncbi:putative duf207 domain-containing protein [Golovinomyces cichoracearum]|uniref:tRNA(Phe) 7-[(3-amino-3-carboxypropyl)-4-demethylwyosine(37)-N(4)]-methyltransferase n=1 Tax=Golovinomyces cichoracearum TaxID=62708 RepID=A0A420JAG2_9PEZI|nr:putative duf207 domain-containing protein [Golovinomyces cichoracearum]